MEFGILGPLIARDDIGGMVVSRARERALLCYLVMNVNSPVADDTIIDALWGESPPRKPKAALQTAVSRLRTALRSPPPDSLLKRRGAAYIFDVDPATIDAVRFERLLESAALAQDDEVALGALDEAIGLWRGSAYSDVRYEDFAQSEIRRLEELRLEALEARIEIRMRSGQPRTVIADLESMVHQFPLRESLWAKLMLALHSSGRQAEALRVFQRARTAISEATGLEPGIELARIEESILLNEVEPAVTKRIDAEPLTNFTAMPNTFVGRDFETDRIRQLLESHRLVTLVGPAGVGKTRLAEQVASGVANRFPGGVFLLSLDKVGSGDRLTNLATAALSLPKRPVSTSTALIDVLRSRPTLIVLDNCEHVLLSAAEFVDKLLSESPSTRILATSRQRLALAVEQTWNVDPLATVDGEELPQAATLFLDRMAAVRPDLDRANPSVVMAARRIAIAADGLPLAIELAASQCYALAPEAVADQLENRLGLPASRDPLVVERHQTLSNAVEWSLRLLDPDQRSCFLSLSVVPESFGLDTVDALCRSGSDAQTMLADLVEHSLVQRTDTEDGSSRFRLLRPIRAIARDHLEQAGELRENRFAYLDFLTEMAGRWYHRVNGPTHRETRQQIRHECWNLLAAIDWALANKPEAALVLAAGPRTLWLPLGHRWVAISSLQRALELVPDRTRERAYALDELALLTGISTYRTAVSRKASRFDLPTLLEDPGSQPPPDVPIDEPTELAKEALGIAEELGDPELAAFSRFRIGFTIDPETREVAEAEDNLTRALEGIQGSRIDTESTSVIGATARLALGSGRYDDAQRFGEIALNRRTADRHISGQLAQLDLLGRIARAQDDPFAAIEHFNAALELTADESIAIPVVAHLRIEIAYLAMTLGDDERANRQLALALSEARAHGYRNVVGAIRIAQSQLALASADFETAHGYLEESIDVFEQWNDLIAVSYTLGMWGLMQYLRHDSFGATQLFLRVLEGAATESGDVVAVARAFEGLAGLAVTHKNAERGAVLLGAASKLRTVGHTPRGHWFGLLDIPLDELPIESTEAMDRGMEMSLEEAIAFASTD